MVSFFKVAVRNFSEILQNLKAQGDKVLPKPDSDLWRFLKTAQNLLGIGGVIWAGNYYIISKEIQILSRNMSKEMSGLDQRITAVDQRITAVDKRITELDASVDKRIKELDASVNRRITEFDASVNRRITEFDASVNRRITEFDASVNKRADYLEKLILLMVDEKIKNNPALKQSEKVESKI